VNSEDREVFGMESKREKWKNFEKQRIFAGLKGVLESEITNNFPKSVYGWKGKDFVSGFEAGLWRAIVLVTQAQIEEAGTSEV